MGDRFHVVKLSGADASELLVLAPGGVWAPIEFLSAGCRFEASAIEGMLQRAPGAFAVRAACDCRRCAGAASAVRS